MQVDAQNAGRRFPEAGRRIFSVCAPIWWDLNGASSARTASRITIIACKNDVTKSRAAQAPINGMMPTLKWNKANAHATPVAAKIQSNAPSSPARHSTCHAKNTANERTRRRLTECQPVNHPGRGKPLIVFHAALVDIRQYGVGPAKGE